MNTVTDPSPYWSRLFLLRTETDRLMVITSLFSCLMVITRVLYTGHGTFLFLVWNLFLAYIPYLITECLAVLPKWVNNKFRFFSLFAVWLFCIPNSFYIITDLFHLGDYYNDFRAPQWFDLAMILSFVWNGLLLGVLSVRQMEKFMSRYLSGKHELFFLYPIMWLNAFGVYIGRYLRFNSWDLITDPFQLLRDIARIVVHPLGFHYAWEMVFCFSILMTLMYLTLKRIGKSFA